MKGIASRHITERLQDILHNDTIPETFKDGLITPVFKGHGCDPTLTDSYRDISVLSTLCKVFEKIMVKRIDKELEASNVPSEYQFAYTKERSTLQANFILHEIISANRDLGRPVYIAFLDVKKCFNSIWHDGIIYKLIQTGVSPRLVLRNLYKDFKYELKWLEIYLV